MEMSTFTLDSICSSTRPGAMVADPTDLRVNSTLGKPEYPGS